MGVASVCCKNEDAENNINEYTKRNQNDDSYINYNNNPIDADEKTKLKTKTKEKFVEKYIVDNPTPKQDEKEDKKETLEGLDTNYKEQKESKEREIENQLNIFIDRFELIYKLVDDFGLEFEPKLSLIVIGSTFERVFDIKKPQDFDAIDDPEKFQTNDEGGKTIRTPRGSTFASNASEQGMNINPDAVIYTFTESTIINLDDIESWQFYRIKLSLLNINNNNQMTPILVGTCHIDLFQFSESKGSVEGKIGIYSKFNKLIGYLYVRMKVELGDANLITNNINESNISFTVEENQKRFLSPVTIDKRIPNIIIVPFNQLNPLLIESFEIHERDNDVSRLNNKTAELYADVLMKSIIKHNDLFTYEILFLLNSKFETSDDEFIAKFFNHLISKKSQYDISIYDYPLKSLEKKNFSLMKLYFVIVYQLLLFSKKVDKKTNKSYEFLVDFEKITAILFESYDILNTFTKEIQEATYYPREQHEEIYETLLWILNSISFLMTLRIIESKELKESKEKGVKVTNEGLGNASTCFDIIKRGKVILDTYCLVYVDTEICSSICKIFRKCITEVLSSSSIYKDEAIKLLILDNSTNSSFLGFLELSIAKYIHYPEVFANMLLILINISKLKDNEITRKLLDAVKVSDLCFCFDQYRFKLKNISKTINSLFYEYLGNITESLRYTEFDSSVNKSEIRKIGNEIAMLFRTKVNKENKFNIMKNLKKFLSKKTHQLHESLCRIAVNLSNSTEAYALIANEKCYFIPHLIDFLSGIDKNNMELLTAKNKKNTKEIESSYAEIVKYSLTCLNTLMTSSPSTKEYFVQVLGTLHISKSSLTKCITQIPEALPSFTNSNKIKASIEDFVKNIEKLK